MAAKIRLAICAQADLGTVPAGKQVIFVDSADNTLKVKKDDQNVYSLAGGGAVNSVNGQAGTVILDPDDLDDSATINKFVTAADLVKLGYITVTQAVDLDSIESLANSALQAGASHTDLSDIGTNTHDQIDTHIVSTSNPHGVTKTQVGLGNVDNTSDIDKPVSSPQKEELTKLIDGSSSYYFTSATSDLGGGRLEMTKDIPSAGGFGISNSGVNNTQALASFCSVAGFPNATSLPSGPLSFTVKARQTAGTKVTRLYAEFISRTVLGVDTILATSNLSKVLTGSNTDIEAYATMPAINNLGATDRLVIVIRANVTGTGTDPDIIIDIQGATLSRCKFTANLSKTELGLGNVDNTSDLDKPISTNTQAALDLKQDIINGNNDRLVWKNTAGDVEANDGYVVNQFNGLDRSNQIVHDDDNNYKAINRNNLTVNATADSYNDVAEMHNHFFEIDTDQNGFVMGINNGSAFVVHNTYFKHIGTADIGGLTAFTTNFELGNGTDPIDVGGFSYHYGFGQIRANVNFLGPMQGYGFQPNFDADSTISSGTYIQSFYDNAQVNCSSPNYTSFNATPTIEDILNNNNYQGFVLNPIINTFSGNASFTGLGIYGQFGTFNTGGFTAINVNPNIDMVQYATGLSVSMDNVTVTSGAQSELVVQDLTYTFNQPGDNNGYTIQYISGGTAGAEVLTILGQAITIQIEDGVSNATQIKAAADATMGFNAAVTVTITGTGSNPQTITSPANFINGINPGNKKAAFLDGDVEITGSLTFGGSLSIGQLNSFWSQALVDGGGTPSSIHQLISQPTVGDGVTINNADLLSTNTAMLLTVGAGSTVTTSFLGLAAMGLPAVVNVGAGSSVDRISGGVFAISLDTGAGAGSAVDTVDLCRTLALPNGITSINKLRGYTMDLPFGDPGTTSWGVYISPAIHNYMAGALKIGGTDTETNSSVALEIESTTKAMVVSRMTTTQRDALTAINGMIIYNTTIDEFQGYSNGSWQDLKGTT